MLDKIDHLLLPNSSEKVVNFIKNDHPSLLLNSSLLSLLTRAEKDNKE